MVIHSRSPVQNFDNWWLWIRKNNNIDKIYLYAKDLSKPNYEFLIKKYKNVGTNYLNYPNAFIKSSKAMDDVYENIDDYNPSRKRKT